MPAARWTDAEIQAFVREARVNAGAVDRQARPCRLPDWLRTEDESSSSWAPVLNEIHPSDRLLVRDAFNEALKRPGEVIEAITRRKEGDDWYFTRSKHVNLLDDDRVGMILVTTHATGEPAEEDITATEYSEVEYESPAWTIQYLDDLGTIREAEGMVEQVFGRTAASLIGTLSLDLFPTDTHADVVTMWLGFVEDLGGVRTMRLPLRRPDGEELWLEISFINRLGADRSGRVIILSHDISQKRAQEAALRAREAELRVMAESVPSATFRMDLSGRITFGNARWHALIGGAETHDGPDARDLHDVVHPDDRPLVQLALAELAASRTPDDTCAFEVRDAGGDRVLAFTCSAIGDIDQQAQTVIGTVHETTLTAFLRQLAETDAVTGGLNRAALDERLGAALADNPDDVVVIFIDLDHFKAINDTHGHAAGDEVLKAVAARLRDVLRPSDSVGRYGGDEFVVLCRDVPPAAAGVVVDRIHRALEDPVMWEGGSWLPHASIGTARSRPGDDLSTLVARADADMFECKRRYHAALAAAAPDGARSVD